MSKKLNRYFPDEEKRREFRERVRREEHFQYMERFDVRAELITSRTRDTSERDWYLYQLEAELNRELLRDRYPKVVDNMTLGDLVESRNTLHRPAGGIS